ncbi:MAG: pilus assembly PilX N-terminal domain-containing protein, partial [Halanaerobiales bacterium]
GFVLVLSMFILVAVLLLVASMTKMLQSELNFYSYNNNEKKAFYAAEAGIAYGKEVFWNDEVDGVWNSDNFLVQSEVDKINEKLADNGELSFLEKSDYSHPENPDQPAVKLRAGGLNNGVEKEVITSFYIYNSAFNNAISSGGDININNNGFINGNIEKGDIYTKGYVYGPQGGTIEDNSSSNKVEIIDSEIFDEVSDDFIPDLDFDQFYDIAEDKGDTYDVNAEEDLKLSDLGDIGDKFTYINGDLEVDASVNDFNGSGVLVVTGQLNIKSNVEINREDGYEDDYFTIIVKGQGHSEGIVLDTDNAVDMQGFVYSYGDTDFKNSFKIDGAIATKGSLTVKNSMEINYESGFLDKFFDWGIQFPVGEGEQKDSIYKIINWREN